MFEKARLSIGSFFLPELKSMFNLRNPAPLIKWGADLLGDCKSEGSPTKPFKQSIWVWRCLQLWLNIAKVPMILKDKEGNDKESGLIYSLLQRPAAGMTLSRFLEQMIISLGLHGEWFLLKEEGLKEKGVPMYLKFIPANAMVLQDRDVTNGVIQSWSIKLKGGGYKQVPASGVIHDYFPNPYDPYRGLAPVAPAQDSIDADFFSRRHNKMMMQKHGRIAGLVSFKDDMQEDTLKRFSQMWQEKYEGAENAGKTAFMGSGAEYNQLSLSAKDMDWMNGMDITREEICAAFGLSTIVAGGLKGATFSNYAMAMKAAWEDTLIPIGRRITEQLNMSLVENNEPVGSYLEFDFANSVSVLQEDQNLRVDKYIKLVGQGKMTPKQASNICQIDLGDPDPAHDVIWVNASELPADAILSEPIIEPPLNETALTDGRTAPQVKLCACGGSGGSSNSFPTIHRTPSIDVEPIEKEGHAPSSEMKKARVRSNLRQLIGLERKMAATLKSFFYEQRRSVLERLSDLEPPAAKDIEGKRINEEWIWRLLSGADWNAKLRKRMLPLITAVAELGARQVIREVAGRFEPVVLARYLESQVKLMQKVNDSTALALRLSADKVVEAAVTGAGQDVLMNELKTAFKGVFNNTEARRSLIARTETTRAMNGGRYEQMIGMGAPLKQWISINDGNIRDSHADLDGTVVGVDEDFISGLRFPGDPDADISETANCRCSVIPIFDRRDIEDEKI